jgi:peroxiredoxin
MGRDDTMTHIAAGQSAPEFSLKGLDGKTYSLETLREKGPMVAAFFKVSCPVCQFTFPFVERLFKAYGSGEVTVLGISQDDAKATANFAREYRITFPMALDEKEKNYPASNAYGLTNVPTIFLIDTDGTVRVSSTGFVKADLETIAAELAARAKMAAAPLFKTSESVPANRPG